jgi:UDP-N-acetylmuramyl pentapeptide phosphotransferase/UDP-N-acetylglucosamine-1-phosphate transferase
VIVTPAMFSVVFPVLVSVVDWGELDWPTRTVPKFSLAGTSLTVPTVIVIPKPTAVFVSITEVAVNVTEGFDGTVAGAVYVVGVPLAELVAESVPHSAKHEAPS